MHPLTIHNDSTKPNILGWFDFSDANYLASPASRNKIGSVVDRVGGTVACDTAHNDQPFLYGASAQFRGVPASHYDGLYSDDAPLAAHAAYTAEFTLLAVVRRTSNADNQEVCGWMPNSGVNGASFLRMNNAGTVALLRNDGAYKTSTSTATVPVDKWVVIGVSVDLSPNEQRLYINGEVETKTIAAPASGTPTRFAIGSIVATGKPFDGEIAAVIALDGALSTTDLQALGDWAYAHYCEPPITVHRAERLLTEFGAVPNRLGAAAAMQTALDAQSWGSGFKLIIPPGPWLFEDSVDVGSVSSTNYNRNLNFHGCGNATDLADFPYPGSGTVLIPAFDDTAKPLFKVHCWGLTITDLTMANSGRGKYQANLACHSFIKLDKVVEVGTGKLHLGRVHFESSPTYADFPAVTTNPTGNNEDESYFHDCSSWGVANVLKILKGQSIGWKFERGYFVDCKSVFVFDGGGKLTLDKSHFRRDFGASMVVVDITGPAARITHNTSIWQITNSECDGGANTTDLVLFRNTAPTSTKANLGTFLVSGCMFRHDTQTVPYIDLEDIDATILLANNTFQGVASPGTALFHLTGISSSNKAQLTMIGNKVGGMTQDQIMDATSENYDLHQIGTKAASVNAYRPAFGFPGSAAVS